MRERNRRLFIVLLVALISAIATAFNSIQTHHHNVSEVQSSVTGTSSQSTGPASDALQSLLIKGKAPKTGYARKQFSDGWGDAPGCDVRNYILKRDMTAVVTRTATDCTVTQGTLQDPYTGKSILFVRGAASEAVQIDHVVALSNAWQTGAQQLTFEQRFQFANDSLNLLAVDGPANQQKSDSDASAWLPPNKDYRCRYVARQIAVKKKYSLWVTQAEHDAMQAVLKACPDQQLPVVTPI